MATDNSILKWDTLLDDAEWDSEESLVELLDAEQAGEPEPSPPRARRRRTLTAVALSTCLACALVLWLAARQGVAAIDAELHNVIEVENWLWHSENITATASLMDAAADPVWQRAYLREMELTMEPDAQSLPEQAIVERTRLRSGLAMVEVTVRDESGETYRETRFYREGPQGWQRTSPDVAFWGREHVLETDHFRIRYRQADAQAVIAAAPTLDRVYELLRDDMGLNGEPTCLELRVEPVTPESLGYLHFRDGRVSVPSPLLLRAPIEMSNDALLVQSIMEALVQQAWAQADAASYGVPWRDGARMWWGPMIRGVQIWQSQDCCETASTGHSVSATCRGCESSSVLPDVPDAPLSLRQLLVVDDPHPHPRSDPFVTWQRSMASTTVVDYFVRTYGRNRLPELVTGFRTHDSWETLVPAVTGVSAAEFEAGWRQYLTDEYGYGGQVSTK